MEKVAQEAGRRQIYNIEMTGLFCGVIVWGEKGRLSLFRVSLLPSMVGENRVENSLLFLMHRSGIPYSAVHEKCGLVYNVSTITKIEYSFRNQHLAFKMPAPPSPQKITRSFKRGDTST